MRILQMPLQAEPQHPQHGLTVRLPWVQRSHQHYVRVCPHVLENRGSNCAIRRVRVTGAASIPRLFRRQSEEQLTNLLLRVQSPLPMGKVERRWC
jgi:hypothetical protein